MAFDPTKPANNSPDSSLEMRNQLNGLKDLIDAQQAQITALQAQNDAQQAQIAALQSQVDAQQVQINEMPAVLGGAKNIDDFNEGAGDISDPPTKLEVEEVSARLDDLIIALKH